MSDIELTKLCAIAMGFMPEFAPTEWPVGIAVKGGGQASEDLYDPLHNDAQAMELVKKLRISIDQGRVGGDMSAAAILKDGVLYNAESENLNRAICETIAKLQMEKSK